MKWDSDRQIVGSLKTKLPDCNTLSLAGRLLLSSCEGMVHAEESVMDRQQETPFENIESALEYVTNLLEASREAREQVEQEIVRLTDLHLARKKEALQIISYKLDRLNSHMATSERLLKDLKKLRRLILEDRETMAKSTTA